MRKALIVTLGVIALVIAALLILPSFLPVDAYKDRLIREVDARTGRHLTIDGKVSLSLIPRIGFSAQKVTLSNPPGASQTNFASFDQLDIAIGLLPALAGRISLDKLVLVDPVIALEVDADGRANWPFAQSGAAPQSAGPAKSPQSGSPAAPNLSLANIDLVNGTITYTDHRNGSHYDVEKINMKVRMRNAAAPFSLKGDMVVQSVPIALTLEADQLETMMQGTPTAAHAAVKSDLMNFSFDGKLSGGAQPQAIGKIDLKIPSAAHFLAWLNQQPAPAGDGLGNLAISGDLDARGRRIAVSNAQLSLDKTTATGNIAFDAGARPAKLTGNLAVSAIDLNPYLAADRTSPSPPSSPPASSTANSGNWSEAPIEAGGLKAMDADLSVALAGFRLRKLSIQQTSLALALAGGRLDVALKEMAAYHGKGSAHLMVDGSQPGVAVQLTAAVSGVEVESLLRDAIDLDRVSGTGALNVALTGRGQSEKQLVSSLDGKGDFHFMNGAVKGLDLGALLKSAQSIKNPADVANLVSGLSSNSAAQKTEFAELSGSFQMTNGIASNKDLSLTGPSLKAEGSGTVDLPQRRVDYRLTPHIGGANSFTVPILITGTFDHLNYRPDLQAMLAQNAGSKVIQRALGKEGDNPAIKNALKGLFGH